MTALFWLALGAAGGYLLGLTVGRWRADGDLEDRCDRCPDRWNVVAIADRVDRTRREGK